MKLHYFGTAACEGWPAVFCTCEACRRARALGGKNLRTRAQVLVDGTLLVDLPPDTFAHMLYGGLELAQVRTLLVTHAHQDHFYPAELVMRAEPYAHMEPEVPLDVYGNDRVRDFWRDDIRRYDDSPDLAERVVFHEVQAYETFVTPDGYTVTALPANHDKKEKCLVYLIGKAGRTLLYANDSGLFAPSVWEFLRGRHLDLVSLDCTCVLEADGSNHMGLPDNEIARDRLAALGCTDANTRFVVTHFSHNGRLMHDEISAEADARGFTAAFDGFTVEV